MKNYGVSKKISGCQGFRKSGKGMNVGAQGIFSIVKLFHMVL